jgi:hypothetical protein
MKWIVRRGFLIVEPSPVKRRYRQLEIWQFPPDDKRDLEYSEEAVSVRRLKRRAS